MVVIVYSKSNAVYVFNGTTDLKSNGVSNVGDATSNVISVYTVQYMALHHSDLQYSILEYYRYYLIFISCIKLCI